ncbi:MAG: DNA methyltransferase [bacterium]
MNKSVAEFIKKYGVPYDPETDDYDVEPFQKSFDNASKSSKIYMMHMYWTKQDPYVVKQFIEHYTKPGDIVLDAFCGTGMTGVAAMMCGRNAVLTEISPACIHIARNYTTPIEPHILERAYYKLREKVEPEIGYFYKTKCHNCKNQDAQIANTTLSDVLGCPRCGAEVLYAGDGRWERMKKGEKFRKILCQNCGYEFTKAKAEFVRIEPIEIRVDCPRCKARGEKKVKPLDNEDWRRYIDIEGGESFINKLGNEVLEEMKMKEGLDKIPPKEPPYWYPRDVKFPIGYNTRQPLKRGIIHPYQMFSRRNLIALSILWHYIDEIEDEKVKDKMRFVFTGILFNVSLMYMWRESGKGGLRKGTLFIPSMIQDMNTTEAFASKVNDLRLGMSTIYNTKSSKTLTKLHSALHLNDLPSSSVDYLYYDPPYGKNINYSELNIMWEAWISNLTETFEEILENDSQSKDRAAYETMMTEALRQSWQLLKPGRRLTIVYSYADPSMYRTVQKMAHEAGFLDEGDVLHMNSSMKTQAQMNSDKTQQRFLVINFIKPKEGERKAIEKPEDIEYDVIRVIQDFLTKHPGKSRDYIYDQVIKQLFTTVKIQKFDLDEILKNFFRNVGDE